MAGVLAAERQSRLLGEVRSRGAVRVAEFADLLGVSEMTVRRDIEALARRGLVDKVHGGAVRTAPSTDEPGFEAKSSRQLTEKSAIAAAAAELVSPGMAVGVSAGTTTWALAQWLRAVDELTVVTNSMSIAGVFHAGGNSSQSVVLTGGVRTPSDALVGPIAVSALTQLHLDIVFMGVHGMSEDAGFTTPNLLEAETDRAFVDAGRTIVVVADHTKWGTVGIRTIADLHEADVLITDDRLGETATAVLREHVADVRAVATDAPGAGQ